MMTEKIKEETQYGLVMAKSNRISVPKPGNIFGEDSGSDEDDGSDWVRKTLRAEGQKNLVKKQTQLTMKRAMKEDPTVYQYDEVYDEIEKSKIEDKKSKKEVEKKSKYIENLLKAADRRKREQEHRVERMVQKEREAEGAMFADKESFVTSAYRAKLEEFKKMEDEEKRMDRLEAIGDVTKQKDMSGFYRQLYHQTVGAEGKNTDADKEGTGQNANDNEDKEENVVESTTVSSVKDNVNLDEDDPLSSDAEQKSDGENKSSSKKVSEQKKSVGQRSSKRQYRKRMTEESQSSSESDHETEQISHHTISPAEKSEAANDKPQEKKQKLSPPDANGDTKIDENVGDREIAEKQLNKKASTPHSESESKVETTKKEKVVKKIQTEKPKISIWEKRTVGPVFDAALERYYARKSARLSA